MSTRPDGMPQGHPEKMPVRVASLTLYSSSTDPTDPGYSLYGQLSIDVPVSPADVDEATATIRRVMHKILDTDNVTTVAVPHSDTCRCVERAEMASAGVTAAVVRGWATNHGVPVAGNGTPARHVWEAYKAAHDIPTSSSSTWKD